MPTSIVTESDLKECIFGSAGTEDLDFCIRSTPLRVRERDEHVERGGVATAGQNARSDKDM